MRVVDLRCEYRRSDDDLGIASSRPRLSWRTETDARDWQQRSYAIEVVDADTAVEVWTSARVESADSYLVAWRGPTLASRQRCRWRVHVLGSDGEEAWSDWAQFEIDVLDDSWTAAFIVPDSIPAGDAAQPVAYLRHEFDVPDSVVRARLHTTALGVHEVELNGTLVGDLVLTPGWTAYEHRVRVETFDVTSAVSTGRNATGVRLADGWYGERFGFGDNTRRVYGDELAAFVELELVAATGETTRVVSDESWRSGTGPILASGIYGCPSWLSPVLLGATTIWERWDGLRAATALSTPAR